MENRRTVEGFKMRVYIDAIKDVRATTDEQWIAQWNPVTPYVHRGMFLRYLELCLMREADLYCIERGSK